MSQPVTRLAGAPARGDANALRSGDAPAAALAALLDVAPQPLLLADAGAIVHFANRAATDLLGRGGALRVRGQRLVAESAADTQRLQRAIATAAEGAENGTLLALRSVNGDRVPVLLWRLGLRAGRLVALFAADRTPATVDMALLRRLYGLTAAEARVAALIAAGHTVGDIVTQSRISRSTARTHLQRALAKTGAGRQWALTHLLLSGPAHLRLGANPDEQ